MRKMVFVSIAFHTIIIVIFLMLSSPWSKGRSPEGIYQVNLVSAPTVPEVKRTSKPKPVVKKKPENPKPKPKPKPKLVQPPKTKGLPEPKEVEKKPDPPKVSEPEVVQEAAAEKELPPVAEEAQSTEEAAIPTPEAPVVSVGVDVPSFKFPFYLKLIQSKIGSEWSPPSVGRAIDLKEVVVSFTLISTGRIQEVEVKKSSGNAYFDQAALRAVYSASPLPPLPKGFTERSLRVHFSFILGRQG